ncbi:MAG: hypothetical protein KTR25_16700 [Myxococcales bacterium]|nr:hypothetical protein [Myxococcales bacterium]
MRAGLDQPAANSGCGDAAVSRVCEGSVASPPFRASHTAERTWVEPKFQLLRGAMPRYATPSQETSENAVRSLKTRPS